MTDESGNIVEWLGLRLRVPNEWEIVRHSLLLERGSLVFVDRRRERLRLYWRDCERAPDLNRMLDDQRGKESLESSGAKFRQLNGLPGWQGFIREQGSDERVVHAAHFDANTLRLIEVIATESGDESAGKSQRARLFGSIEVTSKAEHATGFRAFGLNVAVPAGFRLVKAAVKPGDVAFEFAELSGNHAQPSGVCATVHRMGMAATWAPADMRALLRRESPRLKLRDIQTASREGHPAWSAPGTEVQPRIRKLLGLGRQGEALLWHCESQNALYSIATVYPKRRPLGTSAFSTTCCEGEPHG